MPEPPAAPPIILAILPADYVHTDPTTGKKTVLGVLGGVYAFAFPAVHEFLAVYIAVTDVYNEVVISVEVVEVAAGDEPVNVGELTVKAASPLQVIEFGIPWPDVIFPRPGEYRLQAKHGGVVLNEWRIMAIQLIGGASDG